MIYRQEYDQKWEEVEIDGGVDESGNLEDIVVAFLDRYAFLGKYLRIVFVNY